ncbi:MAG: 50S ribosomal protein L18 [Patescibacteria group bacterium]|nr:50S ribosomal protein L18 [Patescibacteria group bacterium]
MIVKHYKDKKERRRQRIRGKIQGTSQKPRLSVFKSNKHIYAQLIDDTVGETLVSASDNDLEVSGKNKEVARKVGQELAKKAKKKGIEEAAFDRSGYPFHGRVRAVAEGAREGGLKF